MPVIIIALCLASKQVRVRREKWIMYFFKKSTYKKPNFRGYGDTQVSTEVRERVLSKVKRLSHR